MFRVFLNKWVLIIISALAFSFSFPPVEIPYLSLIALTPLFFWIAGEEKFWRLIGGFVLFWLIFAGIVLSFVFEPFLFGANLFILLGAPVCLFVLRRVLQAKHGVKNISCFIFLALPFVWTIFEYLQAVYAPIPSHIIASGNTLAETFFFPLASLGGLYGLSFVVAVINSILAAVLFYRTNKHFLFFIKIALFVIMTIVVAAHITNYFDTLCKNNDCIKEAQNHIRIATFSVNRTFLNKVSFYEKEFLKKGDVALLLFENYLDERFSELTEELYGKELDLIVLPEWLTEYSLFENDTDTEAKEIFGITNNGTLIRAYSRLARELGVSVLASANTIDINGELFNSEILFDKEGRIIGKYDKTQLVLASEYWPFGDWVPPHWKTTLKYAPNPSFIGLYERQFNSNKTPFSTLKLSDDAVFGAPICLEGQIGASISAFIKNGAKFLINDSSQVWIQFNAKGYRKMTLNTSRILARQYGIAIILGGRESYAGMIDSLGNTNIIFHNQYPHKSFVSELYNDMI